MQAAFVVLAAQEPASAAPGFDVVILKRNTSGDQSMSTGSQPGGVHRMINEPISAIVGNACRSRANEIVGAPDWFTTERGGPGQARRQPPTSQMSSRRCRNSWG